MNLLQLENLQHHWQSQRVLSGLSFAIKPHSFSCLVGPSGSGKTTLLRLIAGLEPLQSGAITLNGKDIHHTPAHQRQIGMVFQEAALFAHLTVAQNIGFGVAKSKRRERVAALLDHIGLAHKAGAMPHELSGGQQQRVALARALAPSPLLLLLDEPFSHLDSQLRIRLREDTKALAEREGVTCLMVTHDVEEAMQTADSLLLMDGQGRLHQQGTPHDVFHHPIDRYAATALGEINLLPAKSDGTTVTSAAGSVATTSNRVGDVLLGIRPQGIMLEASSDSAAATVVRVACTGPEDMVCLKLNDGTQVKARLPNTHHWRIGDRATITIRADYSAVFDAE